MGPGKKKIDIELTTYFPGWFGTDLEYVENLRRYYLAKIEEDEKTIKEVAEYFLNASRPKCFNPYSENNFLIFEEQEFEELCNAMEDNGINNVKESTVFEFYSKVQYLEKKVQKIKNQPIK